jgi:hypothetical protein
MGMSRCRHPRAPILLSLSLLLPALACSSSDADTNASAGPGEQTATGGSPNASTGGAPAATGGRTSTGGAVATTGGVSTMGGAPAAVGGTPAAGGAQATGGVPSTGGASPESGGVAATTGGTPNTGGVAATTGGMPNTGGVAATTGGAPNTGGVSADTGGAPITGGNAGHGGATATGGSGATAIDPGAIIVAPNGSANGSGTLDDPTTLTVAVGRVSAGETIYLRGGTYPFGSTISLSRSGSDASPINLRAYPLDSNRPRLDFSSMAESSSNRGIALSGNYWHVYGLDLYRAGDNCMFVNGSNNTIEFSTFSECADTGLQLGGGASNNLIVNCDSYFNADSSLENADGFAAKLDVGTGNRFVGCRAWNNLDDGWDGYLRPADNVTTTYQSCWAIDNGKLKDGSVGAGDGNGFKTGGSDDKTLRHNAVYENCIAAGNVHDGFDHNSNRGSVTILNSAAHDNGSNINFSTSNIAASLTIKNTVSLGTNGGLNATTTDITNNSWQNGLSATADDFVSVDQALLKSPRQGDGSLPNIDYLKLAPSSDLRNAGVDVGLPYNGSAPDLGPFESADP